MNIWGYCWTRGESKSATTHHAGTENGGDSDGHAAFSPHLEVSVVAGMRLLFGVDFAQRPIDFVFLSGYHFDMTEEWAYPKLRVLSQTTRLSLLTRIKDQADSEAWSQFVDIYGPLIYRFGRRKGLQDADATDLMQDVFRNVAQNITRFDYDPQIGRFRSWLYVVASHSLSRKIRNSRRQPTGSGEATIEDLLKQLPADDEMDQLWEAEYRQHLFEWACSKIRPQFSESSWRAFEQTAIENRSPQAVAADLGISVGAVYISKSRVTKKIRDAIASIDETTSF